jgi:hypothetical protein
MSNNDNDSIKKICTILHLDSNDIITFEDFVASEYKRPYEEIKNNLEIKKLRKAWNVSCESLLDILDGITLIARQLDISKEEKNE